MSSVLNPFFCTVDPKKEKNLMETLEKAGSKFVKSENASKICMYCMASVKPEHIPQHEKYCKSPLCKHCCNFSDYGIINHY